MITSYTPSRGTIGENGDGARFGLSIVFGSGYITLPQMAKIGIELNVIGIILITLVAVRWLPIAWEMEIGTLPTEFVEAFQG